MKNMAQRLRCVLFVFVLVSTAVAGAQSVAPTQTSGSDALVHARAFPFDQMPVTKMANGGESRNIVHGVLATGESVSLHESMQPAGSVPNPAHKIQHSEFIVVQEGTLLFRHDGKEEKVGPGGVLYVAFGTLHQVRNIGNGPVKYVVIAIGGDTKK
jgi:mannose-6-phosphate isomerase-like protein (cupin superfamily)